MFARVLAPVAMAGLMLAAWPCHAAPLTDPAAAPAGHYVLDQSHTSVTASVLHLGLSHYTMRFDRLSGGYDYDPADPTASRVVITLDARSLDTGSSLANTLFEAQFLDALTHRQIVFTSTSISRSDANHGQMAGQLTFHGQTRPAVIDVTYDGYDSSLVGGQRMGFSGEMTIQRSDFGSTSLMSDVGDAVTLRIEAEFVRR